MPPKCKRCGIYEMKEKEYIENAIHFLEVEIYMCEERLKSNEDVICFNGVCVGKENTTELNNGHIRFCKQLIDILKGGNGCPK